MIDTARLTVTLDEPVAASRRFRTDFAHDAYDHIPGTVLRGALAAVWIRERGAPTDDSREFLDVFEGDGSFGPLHPAAGVPVPVSVQRHKYQHDPDKCRRLWWDRALDEGAEVCDQCDQQLEPSKGEAMRSASCTTRTRVALDERGVAKEGQLFRQNSLAARTVLTGWVHGPAVRALHLDGQLIDVLQLGGRRSVQGGATLHADFDAEPEPVEQRENRDGTADIILRLLAPGVFVDELGVPYHEPCLDEISDVLEVDVTKVVGSWIRWIEVGGWHAASGLPKPTERAVQAGSTYRIRCETPASEENRRKLMARGVGLRRREGFGALYTPQPPLPKHAWKGLVAPMRGDDRHAADLDLLRAREDGVRQGAPDDTPFQHRLAAGDDYAQRLRKLLSITDPDLYSSLVDYLEETK
ncbi:type III-B CRISPR module-associated Cmr3 family protein [Saccharopolyspora shandongensis]|uniref:type III-B CRISPR module-associated Cmr3 family protein n=1 Tax=Saccharopolyspora shandongensis TaxID=418495 RepID=UPI00344150A1